MIRHLVAAALAVALAAPAAASAPRTTAIDLGGARGFVSADQAAALAGIELLVRAGLDRQTPTQSGLAALVAESVLQTAVDPESGPTEGGRLTDAIDARGASISYVIGQQGVRFYIDGPPDAVAAAAALAAHALAAPSFEPATLAAARAALAERITDEDGDPRLVARAMLRASYYRGGGGQPPLGTAGSLGALTATDAKAFYDAWYRRGDAVITAVGRTGVATEAASRALAAALPGGTAPPATLATRPLGAQPKRIITHRDVGAPYVVLGFAAPALGSGDFAPALVMRSLLGGVFDRAGATTQPTLFRSAGTIYGYDASPAQLLVWINGARIDPEVGLGAVQAVTKAIAGKPLSAAILTQYKETARGQWALETVSLDEHAFAIGNAVAHGLDADASGDVVAAIARVTAADVQRVAKKYFQRFDVALVIPRTGPG